jgi:hypothetical protein
MRPMKFLQHAAIIALAFVITSNAADLAIEADKAVIHTEGAAHGAGAWNLWSNGRVGQPVQIATPGKYQITVRWRLAGNGVAR